MTAETEPHAVFDVVAGDWRVTGTYDAQDNITVFHCDDLFRRFTFPAYKIWNIPAHLDEFVEQFERWLAAESEGGTTP